MSMIRLWQYVFWGKPHSDYRLPQKLRTQSASMLMTVPVLILVVLSIGIGLAAQPALDAVQIAAAQAIDRVGYVETVNPALTASDLQIPFGNYPADAVATGR